MSNEKESNEKEKKIAEAKEKASLLRASTTGLEKKSEEAQRAEVERGFRGAMRGAYPWEGAPVVVKVTVTNGQARVNLPKIVAQRLGLLEKDGEPGDIQYLLLSPGQPGIRLTPVEMIEVEEGPPVVPEGPGIVPPLVDPKTVVWG